MIELKPTNDDGVLEIHMTGTITAEDYRTILTPGLDEALAERDRVRLLVRIGPGFDGYSAKAAWADTKLGLRHWRGFDRIAVVTDVDWIETAVGALGFALPGPVETFDMNELEEARRWLTESLGSMHVSDLGNDIVQVQLMGKLDSAAYERGEEALDAFIRDHSGLKLLLDLREFDGWQGLAALGDHLKLVRDHRHVPSRVAVVGDEGWQKLAASLMRRFISADSRYFDEDHLDDAKRFLA
jgi:hypothetical protein